MVDKTVLIIAWGFGIYLAPVLFFIIMLIVIMEDTGHISECDPPADDTIQTLL